MGASLDVDTICGKFSDDDVTVVAMESQSTHTELFRIIVALN